jgi:kinesin family protein 2/24
VVNLSPIEYSWHRKHASINETVIFKTNGSSVAEFDSIASNRMEKRLDADDAKHREADDDEDGGGAGFYTQAIELGKALASRTAGNPCPPGSSNHVRVVVRARPLLDDELARLGKRIIGSTCSTISLGMWEYPAVVADGVQACLHVLSEERVVGAPTGKVVAKTFGIPGGVFGPESSDLQVFESAVRPLVDCALDQKGVGTVIAYGQTAAGKTHTTLALQDLVASALLASGPLGVSYFELCGCTLTDLVDRTCSLQLREGSDGNVAVSGLSESSVTSVEEAQALLKAAREARATRSTVANCRSSRSHALCIMRAAQGGQVWIVDLAGSERREDAREHDPAALSEMAANNASLANLNECLRLLAARQSRDPGDGAAQHIPYRNSKLTRLLRAALEPTPRCTAGMADRDCSHDCVPVRGGALARRLLFMAHVGPLRSQGPHTLSTLGICRHRTNPA